MVNAKSQTIEVNKISKIIQSIIDSSEKKNRFFFSSSAKKALLQTALDVAKSKFGKEKLVSLWSFLTYEADPNQYSIIDILSKSSKSKRSFNNSGYRSLEKQLDTIEKGLGDAVTSELCSKDNSDYQSRATKESHTQFVIGIAPPFVAGGWMHG